MWLLTKVIERDVPFMTNVLGTLQNFYIHNILPEVLTKKIENSASKYLMDRKTNCNVSRYSIFCDSEKCKWKWFHLPCVNLKRVPRNN